MSEEWPPAELEARVELHRQWLDGIAKSIKAPALWLYGSKDPFYGEALTRDMFSVFRQGIPLHKHRSFGAGTWTNSWLRWRGADAQAGGSPIV